MKMNQLLALVVIACIALTGCSGGSGSDVANVMPADAAATLMDQLTFPEELILAENGAAENYYRLDDTISDYAIYISGSGGTANEVAVLKVADPKNLDNAKSILQKRVDDLAFQFEDYVPAEMVKIKDPVIVAKGEVAILILSDDPAAAKKAANDLLG